MEKEIRPTEKVQIYIYYTSFILYYKFNINWSSKDNISYHTYNQLQFKIIYYDICNKIHSFAKYSTYLLNPRNPRVEILTWEKLVNEVTREVLHLSAR